MNDHVLKLGYPEKENTYEVKSPTWLYGLLQTVSCLRNSMGIPVNLCSLCCWLCSLGLFEAEANPGTPSEGPSIKFRTTAQCMSPPDLDKLHRSQIVLGFTID